MDTANSGIRKIFFSASHRGCISGSGTPQDTPNSGFCGWCWLETTRAGACSQPHVQPARRLGCCRGVVTKESGLSCQRGAFLGPGANDVTAGLQAHRSALSAAFPGQDAPVDRLAISPRFTVAGTAPDLHRSSLFGSGWGTVCGRPARNRVGCQSPRPVAMGGLSSGESGVVLRRSVIAVIPVLAGRPHPGINPSCCGALRMIWICTGGTGCTDKFDLYFQTDDKFRDWPREGWIMTDTRLQELWDALRGKKPHMPCFLGKVALVDIHGIKDLEVEFKISSKRSCG